MTDTTLATPSVYAGSPKRGPVTRSLEDERWLAMLLLLPTLALLGLFIAALSGLPFEHQERLHPARRSQGFGLFIPA
jgi:hypothetical protein